MPFHRADRRAIVRIPGTYCLVISPDCNLRSIRGKGDGADRPFGFRETLIGTFQIRFHLLLIRLFLFHGLLDSGNCFGCTCGTLFCPLQSPGIGHLPLLGAIAFRLGFGRSFSCSLDFFLELLDLFRRRLEFLFSLFLGFLCCFVIGFGFSERFIRL